MTQNNLDLEFKKENDVFVIHNKPSLRDNTWSNFPIWLLGLSVVSGVVIGMCYFAAGKIANKDKAEIYREYASLKDGEALSLQSKLDNVNTAIEKFDGADPYVNSSDADKRIKLIWNLIYEGAKYKDYNHQILEYQYIMGSVDNRWNIFDRHRFKNMSGMIMGWASKTAKNYSWTKDTSLDISEAGLKKYPNKQAVKAATEVVDQYLAGKLPRLVGLSTHYITEKAFLSCSSKGCGYFQDIILDKEACIFGQKGGHVYVYFIEKNKPCG